MNDKWDELLYTHTDFHVCISGSSKERGIRIQDVILPLVWGEGGVVIGYAGKAKEGSRM